MDNLEVKTTEENPQEEQQTTQEEQTSTEQQQEEKLFAGRFKTAEEMETGYKESSQEGIRLAKEVTRLTTELQQAKTPKEESEIKEEFVDLNKHFDANTAKVLSGYVSEQIKKGISTGLNDYRKESDGNATFAKQVTENWEKTKELYPDAANPQSKLHIRANEILFERQLAKTDASGQVQLLTPFAYRIAVEAADAELKRQVPENDAQKGKKGRATSIQGKGGGGTSQGTLSYEQYLKLSDDAKDAYDKSQVKK